LNTTILLPDEAATRRLGAQIAALLPAGAVVALNGPLGAGKTRLVQGLAEACGVDPRDVVSPTYSLIQEYRGARPVFHFDVYRLKDDDEFLALGPDEYFAVPGITVLEWAEKVADCLPRERLEIRLTPVDETSRRAEISGVGAAYEKVVAQLAAGP
jgi:tRNA threonylcarbamoyladenosine biosynthesis protein TsaE